MSAFVDGYLIYLKAVETWSTTLVLCAYCQVGFAFHGYKVYQPTRP